MRYKQTLIDFALSLKELPLVFVRIHGYLYMLPALALLLLYIWASSWTMDSVAEFRWLGGVPWIGSWMNDGIRHTETFLDTILWQTTKLMAISILAPINTLSSARTESSITAQRYTFTFGEFMYDVFRAVLIVFSALIVQGILWVFIWLITWLLGWDMIGDTMLFLLSAFFYGFAYYDYSFERHRFKFGKSWQLAFSNILPMILVGVCYSLLFNIKFVGIVIAPTLCTMLATILYLKGRASGSFTNET